MFSKPKTPEQDTARAMVSPRPVAAGGSFSVLGPDVAIEGHIMAAIDLHLEGRVEGDVACKTLVQGPGSLIRGAVRVESARLAGTVDGSIEAGELVIQASARITGDVSYEKLTIEPGGQVNGRFSPRVVSPKVELVASN
jgi:cytoskeletal protein CcmA (bactofilin family)